MRAVQLSNRNPRRLPGHTGQKADERESGPEAVQEEDARTLRVQAVDVGEHPATALAVRGQALVQWAPTLAALNSNRRWPPLSKKRMNFGQHHVKPDFVFKTSGFSCPGAPLGPVRVGLVRGGAPKGRGNGTGWEEQKFRA